MPTFRDTANVNGNLTTVNLTVPATLQTNDFVLVTMSQNGADVQTAAPSALTQLDSDTTTNTSWVSRYYYGVVGQNGLTAGGTLSWTLSTFRHVGGVLCAWSGVDPASPINTTLVRTGAVTTTAVIPSISPTATSFLVEAVTAKSNGVSITNWTAPSGWTRRGQVSSSGTFSGSGMFADRDAGNVAAGTYGGETYTADQAFNIVDRYIIGLKPAAASSGGVSPVSVDVATGWTPTGGTNLAVISDADGNTYTTTSTGPSALEFDVTLGSLTPPGTNQPLKVFMAMRARSATSASLAAQLFEGATQRSALTGVTIPISTGFPVTDTVLLSFPYSDVQNVTDWSALKVKLQVTAA